MTNFYTPEEAIRVIRRAWPLERIEVNEETLLIIAHPYGGNSPLMIHIRGLEGSGYSTVRQIVDFVNLDDNTTESFLDSTDKDRIRRLCDEFIGVYFPSAGRSYENIKPNSAIELGRSNVEFLKDTEMEMVILLVDKDSAEAKNAVSPYLLEDTKVAMRTAYKQGFKLYDTNSGKKTCVARIRPAPTKNNFAPNIPVRVIGTDFWINRSFLVMLRETSTNKQETKFIVGISDRSNVELSSFFTVEDIIRNLA